MSEISESVIKAIERIQGETLVPSNIESLIYHFISGLGKDAVYDCAHRNDSFKWGYIEGYSRAVVDSAKEVANDKWC